MRSRTDPATQHLATVAAQAAVLRAKGRELAQLRAELDRLIVNAYRDHVPASHLADAAGFSRDTIHAAVRPWHGKKRPRPTTTSKAIKKTTTKPAKTQATKPKSTTKPATRTRTTATKAITKAAEPTTATATTRTRRKPTAR